MKFSGLQEPQLDPSEPNAMELDRVGTAMASDFLEQKGGQQTEIESRMPLACSHDSVPCHNGAKEASKCQNISSPSNSSVDCLLSASGQQPHSSNAIVNESTSGHGCDGEVYKLDYVNGNFAEKTLSGGSAHTSPPRTYSPTHQNTAIAAENSLIEVQNIVISLN
ncbi:hypothetical protein RJ641_017056 [Dillenia turbinata]|uniref:Uncharacterized protein n=1 Tax=Dillenia turbinata TaxID=194707 RepID=A0AAN8UT27_9MAGN